MNLSKELIEKFLANKCTREEAEYVTKMLSENPALMDVYFSGEEWNNLTIPQNTHSGKEAEEMLKAVERATYKKNNNIPSILFRVAAAAVVILVIGVFWLFTKVNHEHEVAKQTQKVATLPTIAQLKVVKNDGTKNLKVALPDGSAVNINPGSLIRYKEKFDDVKREIYLEGEAFFTVAKNKQRPFIVYSKDISTTALGTSFTIKAYRKDKNVTVTLYTGKVVVKQTDAAKQMQDVYLVPGQEITVNMQTFETVLQNMKDEPEKIVSEKVAEVPPAKVQQNTSTGMDFTNEPLKNVFKKLEEVYNISIQYKDAEIDTLDFTGLIEPNESPENILQNIALLNGFTITRTANSFLFQKNQ
ncbi:FecR family protein [Danxiaibacter flavus]|uniref:FecR family protein n=1 Tax=Danxiaibacter flavus TaxID=3049108 RepID=A0ABV3ZKW7_9BACT|nr:FecR family protein [Chitinophagaceae bacterium DXS]